MNKFFVLTLLVLFISGNLFSQVAINTDGSNPDPSAGLDVNFNNKGLLIPRMTQTQISSILNPANGLQVFCTTDSRMYIYVAPFGEWKQIAFGSGTISPPLTCGNPITITHTASDQGATLIFDIAQSYLDSNFFKSWGCTLRCINGNYLPVVLFVSGRN